MFLLKALEKHIPSAKALIDESSVAVLDDPAEELWNQIDQEKTETICVYGVSPQFYALAREWLDEDAKRRLIFVEERGEALSSLLEHDDAILLLNDNRVKLSFLESPLQIEPAAKKVAWAAVFRELSVLLLRPGEYGETFRQELLKCHTAAHLLLSEASDYGVAILKNARANKSQKSGLGLKGKFQGIPAVIVGAGPSLKKNGHLLKQLEDKALILAGGAALNNLPIEPHFAASVDAIAPCRQFKMHNFFEAPFCCQSRMNRENFALIHGPALLFPDSSAPWINWVNGQDEGFETGWTVGNFLTALAVFMGCDPIVLVGMDLCYENERKYAHLETQPADGLVAALDAKGEPVWTQRDWLMAAKWTEEFATRHPEHTFINATEGGLGFSAPVQLGSLTSLKKEIKNLRKQVFEAIESLPELPEQRWKEWRESLVRCQKILEHFEQDKIETEIAYSHLLNPLWQVWKSVFERELELDSRSISPIEKMRLNRILFFQQVLEEHLNEF